MNYPGVINCDKQVIDKIQVAKDHNKFIDGHSPNIFGADLDAYAAAGILNDHECSNIQEMKDRLRRGLYVMIRQGTVCQDELNLLKVLLKKIIIDVYFVLMIDKQNLC